MICSAVPSKSRPQPPTKRVSPAHSKPDAFEKLKALPDDTQVYCGHEYTVENYQFSLTIEPDNQAIQDALAMARAALAKGHPTVPSTIGQEKRTNLFMRANSVEEFASLRRRKDRF